MVKQTIFGTSPFCQEVKKLITDEQGAKKEYTNLRKRCLKEQVIPRSVCRQIQRIKADEIKHRDALRQVHIHYCRGRGP